jgi:SRSO17 transposase
MPHRMDATSAGPAVWDHDRVRDGLRGYVVDHLVDPDGMLVVDETGDVKKGVRTVGTQREPVKIVV